MLGWRKKHEILIHTQGSPEELPFDDKWLPKNFITIGVDIGVALCNFCFP